MKSAEKWEQLKKKIKKENQKSLEWNEKIEPFLCKTIKKSAKMS